MESRKIIALGKSSLVISLPKSWININNLKRGDYLSLETQKDLSLIIHPSTRFVDEEKRKVVVIEHDQDADSITRIIIGCYLNGYNKIQLTSKRFFTSTQQEAIRDIVKTLYLWIIESHASEVVVQVLIDDSKIDFQQGIERMHLITYSMFLDVLKAMEEWNNQLASSVLSLEIDVDQFMYSLNRFIRTASMNPTLANTLQVDMLDCLDYQLLVDRIERIADNLSEIATRIVALKEHQNEIHPHVWDVLKKSIKITSKAYQIAVEHFFERNIEDSNKIIEEKTRIQNLMMSITPLPRSSNTDTQTFYELFEIRYNIKRIAEYVADIAEITIDRAYKQETHNMIPNKPV